MMKAGRKKKLWAALCLLSLFLIAGLAVWRMIPVPEQENNRQSDKTETAFQPIVSAAGVESAAAMIFGAEAEAVKSAALAVTEAGTVVEAIHSKTEQEEPEIIMEYTAGGVQYTVTIQNTFEEYCAGDMSGYVYRICLLNLDGGVLQELFYGGGYSELGCDIEYGDVRLDDVNFDGYSDLTVVYFPWGKSNFNSQYVYLWDANQGIFMEEPIELHGSYEIYEEKKAFVIAHPSMWEYNCSAYRIVDGELLELRSYSQNFESNQVKIYDCVEDKILLEEIAEPDAKEAAAEEILFDKDYYADIFWEGL
ncbi:MAG: hypothetical protein HDR14_07460 [Lachnospiraceae bacterium]|nr:hypothetical protein [Lachnospiraceae bacterium]